MEVKKCGACGRRASERLGPMYDNGSRPLAMKVAQHVCDDPFHILADLAPDAFASLLRLVIAAEHLNVSGDHECVGLFDAARAEAVAILRGQPMEAAP